MTGPRTRDGRPTKPLGRLWWWLSAMLLLTGGLLLYVMTVRPVRGWVVVALVVASLAVVAAFVRTAMRSNADFVRSLSGEDRERHYPVLPARRLWHLLPIPIVLSGLGLWASLEDWLGFPAWNALASVGWGFYFTVLFRSLAARRAGESPTPDA
ncbi:hypothetical protein [Nakamurella deserti]|uniref:hypothetical protein n=1 Tax=Nakamurella deserti TaxID=2164074 RepID=UPI000DBE3770|nr:hypothetical protein [Nakamurella deserti]